MDHFLDALGEMCPIPIIKAEKTLLKIPVNDRVILETDHSCSISSVTNHFKTKYGYPCEVIVIEDGIWQIIIEKKS